MEQIFEVQVYNTNGDGDDEWCSLNDLDGDLTDDLLDYGDTPYQDFVDSFRPEIKILLNRLSRNIDRRDVYSCISENDHKDWCEADDYYEDIARYNMIISQ